MRIDWHKYIAVDFDVHHGEPGINGTRVSVSMIVGSVADGITSGPGVELSKADESGRTSGMTLGEILDAYLQLKKESIQADNRAHGKDGLYGAEDWPQSGNSYKRHAHSLDLAQACGIK